MSEEADVVRRYFDAFNRQDVDAVLESFTDDATIMPVSGEPTSGRDAIRLRYEHMFSTYPDGFCDLTMACGSDGSAAARVGVHRDAGRFDDTSRGRRSRADDDPRRPDQRATRLPRSLTTWIVRRRFGDSRVPGLVGVRGQPSWDAARTSMTTPIIEAMLAATRRGRS